MKILLLLLLFLVSSCANYISKLHKEIDGDKSKTSAPVKSNLRAQNKKDPSRIRSPFEDPFYYATYYKGKPIKLKQDLRPIDTPKSLSNGGNSRPAYKKRTKADDFLDRGNEASLWSGKGKSRYLYSDVKSKEIGDIIVINVFESLKNRISNELKRNFGVVEPKKVTSESSTTDEKKDDKVAEASKETKKEDKKKDDNVDKDLEATNKVYDKISGLIVEEVNQDYLLVKGKKEVIFQKRKREVGVQALISRDDIADNNEIPSDRMLETQVLILR